MLHCLLGYSIEGFKGLLLKITLQGMRRLNTHLIKRAAPMTIDALLQIRSKLKLWQEKDALTWAVCLFGFFLLFRKSNLVPDKKWDFDRRKQLKHGDVTFKKGYLNVVVRWMKNFQFGEEEMSFNLSQIPGSLVCPVWAYFNMKRVIGKKADNDHLFSFMDGSSLTYEAFQGHFYECLAGAKWKAEDFSSHSFCRGGCSFAFLSGVPLELIKLMGNWKSDCYLRYLEFPLEARTAAFELMKYKVVAMGN